MFGLVDTWAPTAPIRTIVRWINSTIKDVKRSFGCHQYPIPNTPLFPFVTFLMICRWTVRWVSDEEDMDIDGRRQLSPLSIVPSCNGS